MPTTSKSQREVLDALADVINVDPHGQVAPTMNGAQAAPSSSFSGQVPVAPIDSQPAVPTKDSFDPLGGSLAGVRRPSQRSTESDTAPPLPVKSSGFGRFANAFRRHHTEEKDQKRREKERRMQRAITDSSRMDVIDRMDLSGLGSTLFHHDSPYDACSPHSNRNQRRAPVHAFDHTIDPMTGLPFGTSGRGNASNGSSGHGRPGLSPLAAATMRKMTDSAGDVPDDGKGGDLLSKANRSRTQPSYQMPTLGRSGTAASTAPSTPLNVDGEANLEASSSASMHSTIDRDVEAERAYRTKKGYMTQTTGNPRGRADVSNPNAEVWGVTSEPWQDFAQPTVRLEPPSRGSLEGGAGSAASSVFDMEAVMTGKQRSHPKSSLKPEQTSSAAGANGNEGPKRSRSLMKRLKHARQYGNVPPPDEDVVDRAEASGAPADPRRIVRHQHKYSPSTPPLTTSHQSAGVQLSDDGPLPRSETNGFSSAISDQQATSKTNANIGRSASIFNRFRGGNKNRDRDGLTAR